MKKIESKLAPSAIGPYSQAISTGDMVFVSGQLPVDAISGEVNGENVASQTNTSLENLKSILEEEGLDLSNVVKTSVYLKTLDDFKEMNEVYAKYFNDPYPARVCFEVGKLPMDVLVEIEAIAVKKQ